MLYEIHVTATGGVFDLHRRVIMLGNCWRVTATDEILRESVVRVGEDNYVCLPLGTSGLQYRYDHPASDVPIVCEIEVSCCS